jgi:hypothetical protein
MHANLTRISWLAGLTLVLLPIGSAVTYAQDLQPQEVLKNNNLKRSAGSTWVLAREDVILKDVRRA